MSDNVKTGPDLQTYQQWAAERKAALPPVRSEPMLAFADSVRNALYVLVEVINERADTEETETPEYLDKYLDAVDKAFDELKANAGAVPRRGSDVGTSPLLGVSIRTEDNMDSEKSKVDKMNADEMYNATCIHCGDTTDIQMWPHRNGHGMMIGFVFACAACAHVVRGITMEIHGIRWHSDDTPNTV